MIDRSRIGEPLSGVFWPHVVQPVHAAYRVSCTAALVSFHHDQGSPGAMLLGGHNCGGEGLHHSDSVSWLRDRN